MTDSGPIVVVKLGGSLLDWPGLRAAMARFVSDRRARGDRLVLVVGGGGAADWVRDFDRIHGLGEEAAHHLAIRSLDLTAHAVAALLPGFPVAGTPDELTPLWRSGTTPILAPRRLLDGDSASDALPHHWGVTSDAISARVAVLLGASELVLLKSTGIAAGSTREDAARIGLTDATFARASREVPRVVVLNLRDEAAGEIALIA